MNIARHIWSSSGQAEDLRASKLLVAVCPFGVSNNTGGCGMSSDERMKPSFLGD